VYKPVVWDWILFYFYFYFIFSTTIQKDSQRKPFVLHSLVFCNINSLHHLRVAEREGRIYLCGRGLLVFSAHGRRSNKIFDLQSKNHHNLFFCFRTLMRIANKCGGGRWKNLLVAEETSVVQHKRPHV
jgi:hypothetical protein